VTELSAIGAVRERRRAADGRASGPPDRREAILEGAERLLAGGTPLHDMSVALIMREAGVARGTFYGHFESKYQVVAALMDVVMEEMYGLLGPYVARPMGSDPEAAIREVMTESARLRAEHGAVFRAAYEHRHAVPELKAQWLRVTEQFTEAISDRLEREIMSGHAPRARDCRQLAAALTWSLEHLLYVAGAGDDANLPGETEIVETMVQLWLGMLYAATPQGSTQM
jgi:AcrR family transcriptional regulator